MNTLLHHISARVTMSMSKYILNFADGHLVQPIRFCYFHTIVYTLGVKSTLLHFLQQGTNHQRVGIPYFGKRRLTLQWWVIMPRIEF